MSELGGEARALIERALSEERSPDRSELERIRRNVLSGAASAAVMLGTGTASGLAGGTSAAALIGLALKGGALGVLVSVASFTVDRAVRQPEATPATLAATRRAEPAPPVAPVLSPPSEGAVEPPNPDLPSAEGTGSRPNPSGQRSPAGIGATGADSPASPTRPSHGSLPAPADLHEETALLLRVQRELHEGRGAEALRLLDGSSPRLSHGQLRQERLAAEVLAACQTGELERARRAARSFARENPATPSAARVRASCVGGELEER